MSIQITSTACSVLTKHIQSAIILPKTTEITSSQHSLCSLHLSTKQSSTMKVSTILSVPLLAGTISAAIVPPPPPANNQPQPVGVSYKRDAGPPPVNNLPPPKPAGPPQKREDGTPPLPPLPPPPPPPPADKPKPPPQQREARPPPPPPPAPSGKPRP